MRFARICRRFTANGGGGRSSPREVQGLWSRFESDQWLVVDLKFFLLCRILTENFKSKTHTKIRHFQRPFDAEIRN